MTRRGKFALFGVATLGAAIFSLPPALDDAGRVRDLFADLPLAAHERGETREGWLLSGVGRADEARFRLVEAVRGRPGWNLVGSSVPGAAAVYFDPSSAVPWWRRWVPYRVLRDSRRRVSVVVEEGHATRNPLAPLPAGSRVSVHIYASDPNPRRALADKGPFPLRDWRVVRPRHVTNSERRNATGRARDR